MLACSPKHYRELGMKRKSISLSCGSISVHSKRFLIQLRHINILHSYSWLSCTSRTHISPKPVSTSSLSVTTYVLLCRWRNLHTWSLTDTRSIVYQTCTWPGATLRVRINACDRPCFMNHLGLGHTPALEYTTHVPDNHLRLGMKSHWRLKNIGFAGPVSPSEWLVLLSGSCSWQLTGQDIMLQVSWFSSTVCSSDCEDSHTPAIQTCL